jgi:hypothetical protein
MTKRQIILLLAIIIVLTGLSIPCFKFSRAQEDVKGVTISPPITDLSLKPGEDIKQTIRVTNPTKGLLEIYPQVMNFRAAGEGGEPDFYSADSEEEKFSLAHWIKFDQTKIALMPQQVVEFQYQIVVPTDAEPGGHYGVVFFATQPPELKKDVSQVAIASMTGSLVLVRIAGDIREEGTLSEFSSDKIFYWKPPVNLIWRMRNSGNVHFKPWGEIAIKNTMLGRAETISINGKKGNVLPQSSRKFEEKYETSKILVGRYSANLRVFYGQNEKMLENTVYFWIIPWWAIVIAGILFFAIIIIIWLLIRRRKKKKGPPPGSTSPDNISSVSFGQKNSSSEYRSPRRYV